MIKSTVTDGFSGCNRPLAHIPGKHMRTRFTSKQLFGAVTVLAMCLGLVEWERRLTRRDRAILLLAQQENARVMSLGPWFSREIHIVYPTGSKLKVSTLQQFSELWRHGVVVTISSSDLTDSLRVQFRDNMPKNCRVHVRSKSQKIVP